MLNDERGKCRDLLKTLALTDARALEPVIIMDGVFFCSGNWGCGKHDSDSVPDRPCILRRVDPCPMQYAVIVGCKAGNINPGCLGGRCRGFDGGGSHVLLRRGLGSVEI